MPHFNHLCQIYVSTWILYERHCFISHRCFYDIPHYVQVFSINFWHSNKAHCKCQMTFIHREFILFLFLNQYIKLERIPLANLLKRIQILCALIELYIYHCYKLKLLRWMWGFHWFYASLCTHSSYKSKFIVSFYLQSIFDRMVRISGADTIKCTLQICYLEKTKQNHLVVTSSKTNK